MSRKLNIMSSMYNNYTNSSEMETPLRSVLFRRVGSVSGRSTETLENRSIDSMSRSRMSTPCEQRTKNRHWFSSQSGKALRWLVAQFDSNLPKSSSDKIEMNKVFPKKHHQPLYHPSSWMVISHPNLYPRALIHWNIALTLSPIAAFQPIPCSTRMLLYIIEWSHLNLIRW